VRRPAGAASAPRSARACYAKHRRRLPPRGHCRLPRGERFGNEGGAGWPRAEIRSARTTTDSPFPLSALVCRRRPIAGTA